MPAHECDCELKVKDAQAEEARNYKKQILEQLEKELETPVGVTTSDRQFSLKINRCVGACGLAPVVTVGKDIYRRVKLDKIPSIVEKYK